MTARCDATRPERTNVHTCQLPPSHDQPHACVCGHRWSENEGGQTP